MRIIVEDVTSNLEGGSLVMQLFNQLTGVSFIAGLEKLQETLFVKRRLLEKQLNKLFMLLRFQWGEN